MIIVNFSPDNIVLSALTDIKWIVRGCRLIIADVKRDLLVTHASYSFTWYIFSTVAQPETPSRINWVVSNGLLTSG